MRDVAEVERVRALSADGYNASQIARLTGIPRRTIGGWLDGTSRAQSEDACDRCGKPAHDFLALPTAAYAYLLGIYLGDGMLARAKKGVWILRIVQDDRYPEIIKEIVRAVCDVMPTNRVGVVPKYRGANCALIYCASRAWPCLFPQHGTGPKHLRRIELTDWQWELVRTEPGRFVRGLIHSDGCRVSNRVARGRYVYPRYFFSNESRDILQIFRDVCDILGIDYRNNRPSEISVARRPSVAKLDAIVGPKS